MDSFLITLSKLQNIINSQLKEGVNKVWIQGANTSNAKLLFIIFKKSSYEIRSLDIKNFRHFKSDGDISKEELFLQNYITQFKKILEDIIT